MHTYFFVLNIFISLYFIIICLQIFQVTKSVISLLRYYRWHKFSIIYEEAWDTVAHSLQDQAKLRNMTVNDFKKAKNANKCCEDKQPCCESGYWYRFTQETKNRTRSECGLVCWLSLRWFLKFTIFFLTLALYFESFKQII